MNSAPKPSPMMATLTLLLPMKVSSRCLGSDEPKPIVALIRGGSTAGDRRIGLALLARHAADDLAVEIIGGHTRIHDQMLRVDAAGAGADEKRRHVGHLFGPHRLPPQRRLLGIQVRIDVTGNTGR